MDVNVILLDDDPTMRALINLHVKRAADFLGINCTVFACATAEEAWQVWRNNKIHAIATDVYLENSVTGIMFLESVVKELPNGRIPSAIITGMIDPHNMDRLWDHGWVATKPIPPWFWKNCRLWFSHINSFWKGLAAEYPEYGDYIQYKGVDHEHTDSN